MILFVGIVLSNLMKGLHVKEEKNEEETEQQIVVLHKTKDNQNLSK